MRAAISMLVLLLCTTTARPQTATAKPKEKTAAEQFKNIQVLKDVPAREFIPTMQFIAGSLGVGCEHCHQSPFSADAKPAKLRAREMMRMVMAINAQTFPDQQNRVTCNTCHRGSTKPERTPAIAQSAWMQEYQRLTGQRSTPPPAPALPEAQVVLAKYRSAVGATNAASLRSRYYKGTLTAYNGSSEGPFVAEQVIYLAGEQVRVEMTSRDGTETSIFDGRQGWTVTPRGVNPMNEHDLTNLRARMLDPLQVDPLPAFTKATTKAAEALRGHTTWAVELTVGDNKTETYYFDQQSGLLVARRGAVQTAFGKSPEETWYDDYRDFDGVKLPMTITTAGVGQGTARRYEEIQINLPIDPKRFEPPAARTGTGL